MCPAEVKIQPKAIWLFGLSGAGKTTLGVRLARELSLRQVPAVLLDGDEVRAGLCQDLGFSAADRGENIRRMAEVARLLLHQGVTPVCACIAPRREHRAVARAIIGPRDFLGVYVASSLATCRRRDPKGLYALTAAGALPQFTGIGSVFEEPSSAEAVVIDAEQASPDESFASLWKLVLQAMAGGGARSGSLQVQPA